MNSEMTGLPALIAKWDWDDGPVAGKPVQTFEMWLCSLKEQHGWMGIEEFFGLAVQAKTAEGIVGIKMPDQLAMRVMQAARFETIGCMAGAIMRALHTKDRI